MKRNRLVILTTTLLALGCAEPPEEAEPEPDTVATGTSRTAPAIDTVGSAGTEPRADGGRALRAELQALGGTDVTGAVTLTPVAGGAALSVEIHGANAGLPYVAELVGGSCTSPSDVIAVLGQVVAGDAGDGAFEDVLDAALLESGTGPRIVRVRGAGDQTAVVACGNLGPVGAMPATGR